MLKKNCPTIAKYGREWLESPLRQWSDGTVKLYATIFDRYIQKHLGRKRVDEIEIRDVQWFIGKLDGLSSARKKNIVNCRMEILNLKSRLAQRHPMHLSHLPR